LHYLNDTHDAEYQLIAPTSKGAKVYMDLAEEVKKNNE